MKKFIYLLIACCFFAVPLKATHLMGGEMTLTHISGYDYEINLTTYRDTLGIPMSEWASFTLSDTAGTMLDFIDADLDTTSGYLLPLFPYGVEVYHFKDTITMPGAGRYVVSWSNCCRNGAIINATDPLSESMYLYVEIEVPDISAGVNSSPEFLNEPVVFMPVGLPWSYNPLPFDPDGDSLAWSITDPLDISGLPIDGWVLPSADPTGPFTIDAVTGTITWTPDMEGNFVTSIQVEEYRAGVHTGTIIRDMQMIVVASGDSLARFSDLSMIGTNDEGYYWEKLPVGEDYTLTLLGEDPDLADILTMTAVGEPFLLDVNPATFSTAPGTTGNSIEGTFSWTPHISAAKDQDYIVVFRLDDGIFATDLAVLYRVEGSGGTGLNEPVQGFGANLFPNPSAGAVTVRVNMDQSEEVMFHVFTLDGKRLLTTSTTLHVGTNDLLITRDLPAGNYWVVLDGKTQKQSLPFVVVD